MPKAIFYLLKGGYRCQLKQIRLSGLRSRDWPTARIETKNG